MTHPRAALFLLLAIAASLPLSCGGNGFPREAPCREGCESNLWPRIIVAVVAADSGEERAEAVQVRARLKDGMMLEGNLHGCPDAAGIVCSYSFFTAPRDRSVTLLVEPAAGGPAVTKQISTDRFNHCGRDVVYVQVTVAPGSPPRIGEPRTVSPCAPPDGSAQR